VKNIFSVILVSLLSMSLHCALDDAGSFALQSAEARNDASVGTDSDLSRKSPLVEHEALIQSDENPLKDGVMRFEKKGQELRDQQRKNNRAVICCKIPCAALVYACVPVVLVCGFTIGLARWATCDCCGQCVESN